MTLRFVCAAMAALLAFSSAGLPSASAQGRNAPAPSRAGALKEQAEKLQISGKSREAAEAARQHAEAVKAEQGPVSEAYGAALTFLGDALWMASQRPEGVAAYRSALDVFERLSAAQPANAHLQAKLAWANAKLGYVGEQAQARFKTAQTIFLRLQNAGQLEPGDRDAPASMTMELEKLAIDGVFQSGRYAEAVALQEKLAAIIEKREGKPGLSTANALDKLAWYALFARNGAKALAASERASALGTFLINFKTKRAHALLLLGRTAEAQAAYLEHKGRKIYTGETWEQVLAAEFAEFRKRRLDIPGLSAVESALAIAGDGPDTLKQRVTELFLARKYEEAAAEANKLAEAVGKASGERSSQFGEVLELKGKIAEGLNRLQEAESLFRRALAIAEAGSGGKGPAVSMRLVLLAGVIGKSSRFEEAEALARRALAMDEAQYGPDRMELFLSLNTLGGLLRESGKDAEAEPLLRRALALAEKNFGGRHMVVAVTLENLAGVLRKLNRLAEAEAMYRRALAIDEAALGAEHPNVAIHLNSLALLLVETNRTGEAEPLFRRSLAISEKVEGPEGRSVVVTLGNLAGLLKETNRLKEAEAFYRRSLQTAEKIHGAGHLETATVVNNLAIHLQYVNRYDEAEALFRRSLQIVETVFGPRHAAVATQLSNMATLFHDTGRLIEAEPLLRRALAIEEEALPAGHPKIAIALNNLGSVLEKLERESEAEPLYRRAVAISEKSYGPDNPQVATMLNNLALLLDNLGRTAEAEPLARRALAVNEKAYGPDHPEVARLLITLGGELRDMGRYDEAAPLVQRGVKIGERSLGPDHPNTARMIRNLATLRAAQGEWADGLLFMKRVTAIDTANARRAPGGVSRRQRTAGFADDYQFFVQMAYRAGGAGGGALRDEAFLMAQRAQSSEAASALAQSSARFSTGGGPLAALVREQQDAARERQGAENRLMAAIGKGDKPAADAARRDQQRLDGRLDQLAVRLSKEFPQYAALSAPEPLSVAAVQALLKPGEALLQYVSLPKNGPVGDASYVWAVTRSDARWVEIPLGGGLKGALTQEVGALRCGLDSSNWTDPAPWPERDAVERAQKRKQQKRLNACKTYLGVTRSDQEAPPFDLARAHRLYKALFGGIKDLVAGKELLIVPSGALAQLPFETLVMEPPAQTGPAGYPAARWLGARQAVTMLPSAASLASLRGTARPSAASRPFVGFGNPLLDGAPELGGDDQQRAILARQKQACAGDASQGAGLRSAAKAARPQSAALFRGAVADQQTLRRQTPLPETTSELCAVAAGAGASADEVILGARMTERGIKDMSQKGALARYHVLHFATHGLVSGDLAGLAEPALVFTPPAEASETDDGLLTASEAAQLRLDADWIVMSACNTAAGGAVEGGEALSGLAQAFFYAGARSLLASHWAVDSDAAVSITTGAFNELKAHPEIGRAEALRRSLAALIEKGHAGAHPASWAPFVLVGEGGR